MAFAHIFKSLVSAWYCESRTSIGEIYGLFPPINTIIHGCVVCATLMDIAFNWVSGWFFSSSNSLASSSCYINRSSSHFPPHRLSANTVCLQVWSLRGLPPGGLPAKPNGKSYKSTFLKVQSSEQIWIYIKKAQNEHFQNCKHSKWLFT